MEFDHFPFKFRSNPLMQHEEEAAAGLRVHVEPGRSARQKKLATSTLQASVRPIREAGHRNERI
jgi:hypothetical protein